MSHVLIYSIYLYIYIYFLLATHMTITVYTNIKHWEINKVSGVRLVVRSQGN
jgi:hypothetical protein